MSDVKGLWRPMLADARQYLSEGRLDRADAVCREVLDDDPQNAAALELAGLVAHARGQSQEAVDLLQQAVAADGRQAQAHYNLGFVLQTLGRIEEASASYRLSLQVGGRSAETFNNLGFALFELGQLDDALLNLQSALRQNPSHAEAHNNLGLVLAARGEAERAVESYRRAVRLKPEMAEAHFNLALVLAGLGRSHEAIACYRRVIDLKPDHAEADIRLARLLYQVGDAGAIEALQRAARLKPDDAPLADDLGNAYARMNRFDEAIEQYRTAVRMVPEGVAYLNNLGHGLRMSGKLDEAAELFERVLQLSPNVAEAHANLGRIWVERRLHGEAIKAFERALEIDPDNTGARTALGSLLKEQGRDEDAIKQYEEALRRQPNDHGAHVLLGNAYTELRRYEEAERSYRDAILLEPADPVTHSNLANALNVLGRPQEGEAESRLALALKPDFADAHHNRSIALMAMGRDDEALAARREALRLKPDYPEARLCHSLDLLRQANFDDGWTEYEWRWKLKIHTKPTFTQPEWDGSPLLGRTILLYAEQGLGDTLQFIRYAPLIQKCGGRVVVECQKPLVKLLSSAAGIDELVPAGEALPHFDVQLPLLSAPRLLRTTLDSIPRDIPYLFPEASLVEQWRRELAAIDGFKIGIAWQGNRGFMGDTLRSLPLIHFEHVAGLPGVRLFSLQKGFGREQLTEIAGRFEVLDLTDRLDVSRGPFMDTAAVMRHLDLVVTSDSAIAHLAGALGVPVWTAVSRGADWRWLDGRDDSPWYPTMRIFRQRRLGDWEDVFQRIAAEVEREMARRGVAFGTLTSPAARARIGVSQEAAVSAAADEPTSIISTTLPRVSIASDAPLISVVIPCYNGSAYLAGCVQSVLAQNANCEIIVVDDGSTDDSLRVATELMRQSPVRMTVITQANRGPAVARNNGLRFAEGKYVCFLDVDDQYGPGFFAAAVARLDGDPSAVAVGCGIELVNLHRPIEQWQADLIADCIPGNLMILAEAARRVGGFPAHAAFRGLAAGEDVVFRWELARLGTMPGLAEPYYKYRVRPGSHFDCLLDRVLRTDNGYEMKWLTPEERDGRMSRAIQDYQRAHLRRRTAASAGSLDQLMSAADRFEQLRSSLDGVEGYLKPVEGFALYWLARHWPVDGCIVEVGSFKGRSTCWLASGCREANREKLVAVDHFRGSPEHQVNGTHSDADIAACGSTLAVFRANVQTAGLRDWIDLRIGDSAAVSQEWAEPIRMVFIDGDHSWEAVTGDFAAWSKHVSPHGLVVFHDVGVFPDVTRFFEQVSADSPQWKAWPRIHSLGILEKRSR